jgi:hypothetical protein
MVPVKAFSKIAALQNPGFLAKKGSFGAKIEGFWGKKAFFGGFRSNWTK